MAAVAVVEVAAVEAVGDEGRPPVSGGTQCHFIEAELF
jgi:hypothetical protein